MSVHLRSQQTSQGVREGSILQFSPHPEVLAQARKQDTPKHELVADCHDWYATGTTSNWDTVLCQRVGDD